jgi:hypothetical protein
LTKKLNRLEGNGGARFVKLMQLYGRNVEVDFVVGKVTSASPLQIRLNDSGLPLDRDDLIVAEYLTKHTRKIKIDNGAEQTLEFQDELAVGDAVILAEANDGQLYYVLDRAVI